MKNYEDRIPPVIGLETNSVHLSALSPRHEVFNTPDLSVDVVTEALDRVIEQQSREQLAQHVATVLLPLSPIERRVLQLRMGLTGSGGLLTQRAAAKELGIPKSTLNDTEARAIKKLRRPSPKL